MRLRDQHRHRHGHRRAHAAAGDRERAGRAVGPAIKPIALLKVKEVYEVAALISCHHRSGRHHQCDRCAGVHHRRRQRRGRGTALFYDPLVCTKINAGIAEYLAANQIANVQQLVGRCSCRSRERRGRQRCAAETMFPAHVYLEAVRK